MDREAEPFALGVPRKRQLSPNDVSYRDPPGLSAVEDRLGDVGGEERESQNLADIALVAPEPAGKFGDRASLAAFEHAAPAMGPRKGLDEGDIRPGP